MVVLHGIWTEMEDGLGGAIGTLHPCARQQRGAVFPIPLPLAPQLLQQQRLRCPPGLLSGRAFGFRQLRTASRL